MADISPIAMGEKIFLPLWYIKIKVNTDTVTKVHTTNSTASESNGV